MASMEDRLYSDKNSYHINSAERNICLKEYFFVFLKRSIYEASQIFFILLLDMEVHKNSLNRCYCLYYMYVIFKKNKGMYVVNVCLSKK